MKKRECAALLVLRLPEYIHSRPCHKAPLKIKTPVIITVMIPGYDHDHAYGSGHVRGSSVDASFNRLWSSFKGSIKGSIVFGLGFPCACRHECDEPRGDVAGRAPIKPVQQGFCGV